MNRKDVGSRYVRECNCVWYPCDRVYTFKAKKGKKEPATHPQEGCANFRNCDTSGKTYDIDWGPDAPTAIDLFCGCGGSSLGLIQAGYNVLCGIDLAKDALSTYQYNIGNAIRADVKHLPLRPGIEPTVVAFSPPCPGFSRANTTGKKDKDGKIKKKYRDMNRLCLFAAVDVEYLQPKAFFMENVPPVEKSAEFKEMVKFFKFECVPPYDMQWQVLDAADFGVPQHRKRLIAVGFQMKIECIISVPYGPYAMLPLPDFGKLPDEKAQKQLFEFDKKMEDSMFDFEKVNQSIWTETGLFNKQVVLVKK